MNHKTALIVYGFYIPIFAGLSWVQYGEVGGAFWLVSLGLAIGAFVTTWRLVLPLDGINGRLIENMKEILEANSKLMTAVGYLSNETLTKIGHNEEPNGRPN